MGAILIIEDEPVLGKNMLHYLQREGFEAQLAATALDGLAQLESFRPDAVVLDFNLPDVDGLELIGRIQGLQTGARILMVTGHGNVELAVDAMKAGAFDFLTKPVSMNQLRLRIEQAIGDARRDGELRYLQRRDADSSALAPLIGESRPMQALKSSITRLLEAESHLHDAEPPPALVLGETGSGKEVVARALHEGGLRKHKPFVELNCAALPAQLLESELFGHERGAFTDARERKLGLVETAEGGTLFLDEIGDMDLALQAKLLKLLEEKTVRRLGSVREQRVSVRIVAATHRPLEALVREGRFRADLYYRLCVVQLHLPALRERGDDLLLLAGHFLETLAARYAKPPPVLSGDAVALMKGYPWPGNVRELRNVLEQAVLMNQGGILHADQLAIAPAWSIDLPAESQTPQGDSARTPLHGGHGRVRGPGRSGDASGGATLSEIERTALLRALRLNGWNVSRAARSLGITRDTLRYRIDKYGLNVDSLSQDGS